MKFCRLCGNKRKRKKPSCKTRSQYHATRSAAPRNSNELVPPTRSRYIYRFQWEGPQRRTETKIKKKKSHYRAIHQVPSGRREPIRPQLSHPNRAFYSIFLRPERRVIRTLPPPSIKRATGEDTQPAKVKKRPLSTLGNKKKKQEPPRARPTTTQWKKMGGVRRSRRRKSVQVAATLDLPWNARSLRASGQGRIENAREHTTSGSATCTRERALGAYPLLPPSLPCANQRTRVSKGANGTTGYPKMFTRGLLDRIRIVEILFVFAPSNLVYVQL